MIFSTSCLNKLSAVILALLLVCLPACIKRPQSSDRWRIRSVFLQPQKPSPQAAADGSMAWEAKTVGGHGKIFYEFHSLSQGVEVTEQVGLSPEWKWAPRFPGEYQVKVIARDNNGHEVQSGWSSAYKILPAVRPGDLLAVLPIDNQSGVRIPDRKILEIEISDLKAMGFRILAPEKLDAFMKRHRVRYTGGVSSEVAAALRNETGVKAVLITSLDAYQESGLPKLSIFERLVTCRQEPVIVWIDGVGLSGGDNPGLLGLGLIKDSNRLLSNALGQIHASLQKYLDGEIQTYRLSATKSSAKFDFNGRFKPFEFYKKNSFKSYSKYNVAILPFRDRYSRISRSSTLQLYLIKSFFPYQNLTLIEPGIVRSALLRYHIVMKGGTSLAVSDILSSPGIIGANIIISGDILSYQDSNNLPKLDFSLQVFNAKKRTVVCWSRTSITGKDNTYFFNLGKILLAHRLVDGACQAISSMLMDNHVKTSNVVPIDNYYH